MVQSYNQVVPLTLGKSNNKEKQKPLIKHHPVPSNPIVVPSDSLQIHPRNSLSLPDEELRRKRRAERFNQGVTTHASNKRAKNTFDPLQDEEDYSNLNAISTKSHRYDKSNKIVGRCQTLEKSYLRLTSEPNPDFVRPANILTKAFKYVMDRYNKKEVNYTYLCDQLKSIRQDMRVQMIETKFTIQVYQAHARVALQNDDLGEFNQCQSRLFILYEMPELKKTCYEEFVSYLILYYIMTEDAASITSWRLKLLKENPHLYQNERIQKMFDLSQTIIVGDFSKSISIAKSINGVATKLTIPVIERERLRGLMVTCKSYNQLDLKYMCQLFRFSNVNALMQYLTSKQLESFVIVKNPNTENEITYLDTKQCRFKVKQTYDQSRRVDIKGQI